MVAFLQLLAVKQGQMYIFYDFFFSGVPSARKVIKTFTYSKHDALRSMRQGSCIMHH